MNQTIKNILGVVAIILLASGSYGISKYVQAYGKSVDGNAFRTFTVNADHKVTAVPDVARFTFSITTEGGKELGTLQQENSEKSKKVVDFLKANGVADKDIRTDNYNVSPRFENYNCYPSPYLENKPVPCPPPAIVGYTITNVTAVKVRDFNAIGKLLAGAVSNGVNTVSELSFTIDDPSKLEQDARTEAIRKAKEKANDIAKAGGFRIGNLVSIGDNGNDPWNPYRKGLPERSTLSFDASGVATTPPSIEPGSQEVNVSVSLTYEIK